MKKTLKPLWRFSQKGNLWSIYNAGNNYVTGETRDYENKIPHFFTIESKTGKVVLKNFVYDKNDSLLSSIAASEKYLFLSRLISTEAPIHKGIIAIDLLTGEKVWENNEYEYMFHTTDSIYSKKTEFENIKYQKLDINSGEIVENYHENNTSTLFEIRNKTFEKDLEVEKNFPLFNKDFATDSAKEIFKYELEDNQKNEVEFIETEKILIFTYSKKSIDNFYQIYLCIYDKINHKKIFEEKIYNKAPLVFPDNFFIVENLLYYIKEKKELVAIKLNS
ncbi:MAG: DUF4905 domain-containing protein [Ignavibacteria bacterium]|nr:DUF4905 domain-containing protein [Ignavibacteria bacterium]